MKSKKTIGIVAMFALLQVFSSNHINAAIDEDLFYIAKENTFGINDYNLECDVNEDGNINVFDVIRIKRKLL